MAMNFVAQNADAGSAFLSKSQFDEFLFAPVIDDANGMTVTVLSMLARAGFDPRSKAAELVAMTAKNATEKLTSLITDLLQGLVSPGDSETIAARLAALLPRRSDPINTLSETRIDGSALTEAHLIRIAAILICLLLLGAIWATASRQSLASVGEARLAGSAASALPTPPSHTVK